MAHAFLSYVREDSAVIDEVAEFLRSHGVLVWLDRDDIEPGRYWKTAIAEAIESGAFFVAFFSEASLARAKTYMNEELSLALQQLRLRAHDCGWFIPVLIDDVLPPPWSFRPDQTLQDFQAVRWFEGKEKAKVGLLRALGIRDLRDAEERQLVSLLVSQFPSQRDYAMKRLCQFRSLSSDSVKALTNLAFIEDSPDRKISVAESVLKSSSKSIDKLAVATLYITHDECRVRVFAYRNIFELAGESEKQAYIRIAMSDECMEARRLALRCYGADLRKTGESFESVCQFLSDKELSIRQEAADLLISRKEASLWSIISSKDRQNFAKVMGENPGSLIEFGKYLLWHPTDLKDFENALVAMSKSGDPVAEELASTIRRRAEAADRPAAAVTYPTLEAATTVKNRRGLDGWPVSRLATLAGKFDAEISFRTADNPSVVAEARSIMGLMMLAARQGDVVTVSAYGPEAAPALDAIIEFIDDGMGDST